MERSDIYSEQELDRTSGRESEERWGMELDHESERCLSWRWIRSKSWKVSQGCGRMQCWDRRLGS